MRCAEAMSMIWHTGHSEEIRSPDECARTVVRRRRPASLSMPVAWIVAISCRPDALQDEPILQNLPVAGVHQHRPAW